MCRQNLCYTFIFASFKITVAFIFNSIELFNCTANLTSDIVLDLWIVQDRLDKSNIAQLLLTLSRRYFVVDYLLILFNILIKAWILQILNKDKAALRNFFSKISFCFLLFLSAIYELAILSLRDKDRWFI